MTPSPLRRTSGIYSLITTFLFIMVVLFAVIAIIYVGSIIKTKKADLNDELVKYNYFMDAKNRLLSGECYGQSINEAGGRMPANETCEFPEGLIKGYIIRMLPFDNCTNQTKEWVHMFSGEEGQEYPYFVPIVANGTGRLCPGKLVVIY
jgi:hypothetical protein